VTLLLVYDCSSHIILVHSQCDILLRYKDQNNHNAIEGVVFPLFHQ